MQYEPSNNRISLCTENESGSYLGQTSQLEPGNSIQGTGGSSTMVMTTKNTTATSMTNGKRQSFKSSERASKVGTANLKVQT